MSFSRVATTGFTDTVTIAQANQLDIDITNALDGFGSSPITYTPTSVVRISGDVVNIGDPEDGLACPYGMNVGLNGLLWSITVMVGGVFTYHPTVIYGCGVAHSGVIAGTVYPEMWHSMSATSGTKYIDTRYSSYLIDTNLTNSLTLNMATDANWAGISIGSIIHGQSVTKPEDGQQVRIVRKNNGTFPIRVFSGSTEIATLLDAESRMWVEVIYYGSGWTPSAWGSNEANV